VIVIDHGRHPSLVLPSTNTEFVRYAYGDWNWYALSDESPSSGIKAFFWPTQGTLGRKTIQASVAERPAAYIKEGYSEVHAIPVERTRVQSLRRRLDQIYHKNEDLSVYNERYDLHFVPYPQSYRLWINSNSMLAQWLEELGCEVSGLRLFSNWKVRSD
jgi:hypothetical protein